jgi:hypothetical protein
MISWLRKHKFEAHLITFSAMILASIGLYRVVDRAASGLVWPLMAVFILANLAAMFVK